MSALLVAAGIRKEFEAADGRTSVLKNVDFEIPAGAFASINGPSGSGKSTLLNILVGLEPPTAGTVRIDGQQLYKLGADGRAAFRSRTLGMVYQSMYWVKSLTVRENVAVPLYISGTRKADADLRAQKALEQVGMGKYGGYRPTVLSGGQQQRVGMARAVVTDPKLIVADEPTGNLDSKNGALVMDLLRDFNKRGKTVILVTHNPDYLKYSDYRLFIRDGSVHLGEEA